MAAAACSSRKQNVEQAFGDIQALPERENPLASPQLYDVFICHRGPDVKDTLASQLYLSLQKRRCRAFLDKEEIKGGECISSTIHNAICSSFVHVVIFSKRFAESKWCLDEVLLMLQQNKALFIPVFYEVDPRELRYIETGVYAAAFSEYERKKRNLNKLDEWRRALQRASDFSGYEISKYRQDLCDTIVSAAAKWIEARRPLHVATHPVGLHERVKDFDTFCAEHGNIKTVGIFGLGGSGKTTLAKELFNRNRSNYDASCFLHDVREASAKSHLHSMQTKLLKDLFGEDRQFDNVDEGTTYLRDRLHSVQTMLINDINELIKNHFDEDRDEDIPQFDNVDNARAYLRDRLGFDKHMRFLIVLDDIDRQDQLDALSFTDMQSPDNMVIVTTRDQRVLTRAKISVQYNMKMLDAPRATELFCWHAFLQPYPDIEYQDLVASFVKFCGGLPLSLIVLGSHVRGSNDRTYWKLELAKVEKTLPQDIMERLKISFDSLDGDEKQIFMEIACFFIGEGKDGAIRIWKDEAWSAEHALQTLIDRNLVEVEVKTTLIPPETLTEFIAGVERNLVELGAETAWVLPEALTKFTGVKGTYMEEIVFRMHDHLRDLGRRMAEELNPPRLSQPHRLRYVQVCYPFTFRKLNLRKLLRLLFQFIFFSLLCFLQCFLHDNESYVIQSLTLVLLIRLLRRI